MKAIQTALFAMTVMALASAAPKAGQAAASYRGTVTNWTGISVTIRVQGHPKQHKTLRIRHGYTLIQDYNHNVVAIPKGTMVQIFTPDDKVAETVAGMH